MRPPAATASPSRARARLASTLYNLAWRLALPVVLLRMWWRGRREPRYRHAWAQRLGWWREAPARPLVWLHAVSLGETRAAEPLLHALRRQRPDIQLLLTASTATGWEAGRRLLAPGDLHGWAPLDLPGATRRFMAHFRPDLGILMETETWPNLLNAAHQLGVPMVLANARLSERSLAKGQRSAALTRPMMARLDGVLAQTAADAARLIEAGVPPERVEVAGQLKYDMDPAPELIALGRRWREDLHRSSPGRRVVLAASWREGEDPGLLMAWAAAIGEGGASGPRPLLLLVPRHPQRFDEVADLVRRQGLRLARRSAWGDDRHEADVWLGDSLGEMAAYYAAADVALLGGSFAPLGGQNLIEAAACGCPLIMGPHTFNFAEAAQAAAEGGAAWVEPDVQAGVRRALTLQSAELSAAAHRAQAFAAEHGGASRRMAARLLTRLPAVRMLK